MSEQLVTVGTDHIIPYENLSEQHPVEDIVFTETGRRRITTVNKEKFDLAYVGVLAGILLMLVISLVAWKISERKSDYEDTIRSQAVETYKAELQAQVEEESAARSLAMNSEAERIKYEIDLFAKLFEGVRDYHFSEKSLITYGLSAYNRVDNDDPLYPDTLHEVLTKEGQYESFSDDNYIVSDYRKIAEKLVNIRYNSESKPITSDYVWAVFVDGEVWLTKKFGSSSITDYWQYSG